MSCYLIYILGNLLGWAIISYDGYAESQEWPVDPRFESPASFPKLIAYLTILWTIIGSFFQFEWYGFLIVGVAGFAGAFLFLQVFRRLSQYIATFAIVPAFVLIAAC